MARFNLLWRFAMRAPSAQAADAVAASISALIGTTLPPVRRHEVDGEWMTDVVAVIEAHTVAAALGETLAAAGRVGPQWLVAGLGDFEVDGGCFATFNAGEGNAAAVAGVFWGLAELWRDAG